MTSVRRPRQSDGKNDASAKSGRLVLTPALTEYRHVPGRVRANGHAVDAGLAGLPDLWTTRHAGHTPPFTPHLLRRRSNTDATSIDNRTRPTASQARSFSDQQPGVARPSLTGYFALWSS